MGVPRVPLEVARFCYDDEMASSASQPSPRKPVIGITMGEPAGIGPEIIVKALADREIRKLGRFVIYGMNELLAYAADLAEIDAFWWRLQHDSQRADYALVHDVVVLDYDEFSMIGATHRPTKQGGQASLRFLDDAIAAAGRPVDEGGIDALVTAPICKESWTLTGCRFPGHTELLAHRTRSKRVAMMFHSPQLNVVLATVHVPLMDIRNLLTIGAIYDPIDLGHQALQRMGIARPRIAVCGLNPHASENGQFGDEESRLITPAIEAARQHGIDAHGPFPADTVFNAAVAGKFDLVVAMYHDQGLIPIKLLAWDEAVNVTLGLPIIRTSPDHGTAFDIAGKNQGNPDSMKSAIRLAARLAGLCATLLFALLLTACGNPSSSGHDHADAAEASTSSRVEGEALNPQPAGTPEGGELGQVPESQPLDQPLRSDDDTVVYALSIPVMHCEGCVANIRSALSDLEGVDDARVSLAKKTAWVKVEERGPDTTAIKAAVEKAGYDVESITRTR